MNILTIDVEDWFTLTAGGSGFSSCSRLERELEVLTEIVRGGSAGATFFISGEIVNNHKELLRELAREFDIGLHGYRHVCAGRMSVAEFRQDVLRAKDTVETLLGRRVTKFRAPYFAISKEYVKELFDCGIETDCSCASINHQFGKRVIDCSEPCVLEYGGRTMREFPPSPIFCLGMGCGFLGGGYFRLLPYRMVSCFSNRNKDYLLSYIHPRDLDADQPLLPGLSPLRRFKSYVGLKGAEKKLRRWLADYTFTDIATAEERIDWQAVPAVHL